MGNLIFGKAWPSPEILIRPEPIFSIGPLQVTNTMLTSWLALVVLILLARWATANMQLVPRGWQNALEGAVEYFYNLTVSIAGATKAKEIFPYAVTLFLFIWTCNWIGVLPLETFGPTHMVDGVTQVTPLFRTVNSDLNSPLAMAILTMVLVQIYGFRKLGFAGYLGKFFNFKQGPIMFVAGLFEIISEFAKIISFTFRLFGNIFAGTVLLTIIPYLLPVGPSIIFLLFELFVGMMQAFVFAVLAVVFMTLAASGHESSHEGETAPAGAH